MTTKNFQCPYSGEHCDKINTVKMTMVSTCTNCNHYYKAVFSKFEESIKQF